MMAKMKLLKIFAMQLGLYLDLLPGEKVQQSLRCC